MIKFELITLTKFPWKIPSSPLSDNEKEEIQEKRGAYIKEIE